jgi:type III pantothenate kinase
LWGDTLSKNTAKLPTVEIIKPIAALGRSTVEGIQSGIYYGAVGACRELLHHMKAEVFQNESVTVLATGGFAPLFENQGLYDILCPDLVLEGIRLAALMND